VEKLEKTRVFGGFIGKSPSFLRKSVSRIFKKYEKIIKTAKISKRPFSAKTAKNRVF
jgi:hypothetical protein